MTSVVLVGGNGYIGREIAKQWVARDPEVELYLTSRSDRREVTGDRIHHVRVDVNDAAAFEASLPERVDYIVNLTYASDAAVENIRDVAEKRGAQAIGNIGIAPHLLDMVGDFGRMRERELALLREGTVRVENYPLTVAYGAGRDDETMQAVKSGAFDAAPPVHVEVVARQLIDQLTRAWLIA